MKKSLQDIEDFYVNKGHVGNKLRKILEKDKDYVRLVKLRKERLTKELSLSTNETKKYVMSTDKDYDILSKVKVLEKLKLNKEEKFIIKLIRTQLEHDWRKWL